MNEILRALKNRKSVRVYEERTISKEDKEQILLAAMEAPTAGNQQMYTILDITDQALKERLSESCHYQRPVIISRLLQKRRWCLFFVRIIRNG